jgi:diguanylate cyclase (GGDEF)-like protein
LLAVDAQSDSVVAVRRISTESTVRTVAVRMPVDQLLDNSVSRSIETIDARVVTGARSQQLADELEPVQSTGGLWTVTETIGSPFVDGAIEVTANVDRSVGIAGDRTLRYVTLLGLGTVLLALAGWTFLVERRQLERRATTDELTQLINRREFERVSEEALDVADRFGTGLCVMVIDLNGFKQVNDTLGHQFGDLVLTASSERLVAAVRDTDVVGRWGGDEFVILLPGLAERSAVRNSAERIWNSLAGSPVVGDTVMTGSIGAAIFPRHGTTLDALMRAADVAMYEAKTTGVSHRIADTIAVGESLLSSDDARVADEPEHNDPPRIVNTDDYAGPDRRKSPVPPPPMPPPGMSALSESAPPGDARVDEPSAL